MLVVAEVREAKVGEKHADLSLLYHLNWIAFWRMPSNKHIGGSDLCDS
jgi:hypothetical protein